ncbi:MAG: gliding motility-associated C-terminal domain-containing protein [Saprospiraceae bacterium]
MKIHNSTFQRAIQFIFVLAFISFFPINNIAQVQVGVTINTGTSTTTCGDVFGQPDPRWRVRVGTGAWVNYANNNSDPSLTTYPNLAWAFPFDCQDDIPTSIQVCLGAFEEDPFGESCAEEDCQNFAVPAPGSIADYTFSLPIGGDSEATIEFSIGAIGVPFESLNDEICNASNLGVLPTGGTLGDANAGGYNNLCASNTNEPNPVNEGQWPNEQGVWLEFTTSNAPGYDIVIDALNDPMNIGNAMNIELALYTSDNGTCTGNMTMVASSFDGTNFNESLTLDCPEPNTNYFILVDGNNFDLEMEGHFGIEISDIGVMAAPDVRCDAYDLGVVPVGGNTGVYNVHNECANNIGDPNPSAFISQNSVWFTFQAPPSGSVLVEALSVDGAPWNNGIGAQIGVYRSFNNTCTGFFFEVGSSFTAQNNDESIELNCLDPGDSYWILVDGSGSNTAGIFDVVVTDLENYPPELTIDTTVCFGGSFSIGNSTYTTTGNYTYVFNLANGCDSTVYTNLIVADLLEADAQPATLASSATAADGSVIANEIGGTAPFTYLWSNGAVTQLNENIPAGNYCVTITDAIGCTAEDCVDLDFSILTANATGDALDCFGDMDGTISFSVSNGNAPYTYSYENTNNPTVVGSGSINADGDLIVINSLPAGNYQIEIEDDNGSTTMAFTIITEPLEISSSQDFTLCFGESVVIGNTIYDATGMISETLLAANGCDSLVSGMVTILPDPSFTIDSTICFGENILVANSTYTASGTYFDTLTNGDGCDSIITTNLTVLDEINITIDVDVLPTGYNQPNGTLTAQATGGDGNFTYLWSNGQTTATGTNLSGGTEYCVVVTDGNGCSNEMCSTILYEPNIAIALNDTLNCFGDTDGELTLAVANGLGDYNFNWINTESGVTGNGTITGNIGSTTIINLGKGNYNIIITDTYVSQIISVDIIEPLPLQIETISNQEVTCQGDCNGSVVLNTLGGTGPFSYSWSGGVAPVADPTDLCPGDYIITVTDANDCTATFNLTIDDPVPFSVIIEEVESISCGGEADGGLSAVASGGTGTAFQYLWSDTNTGNFNSNLVSGAYEVTVTDGVGCTAVATYDLAEPTPITFDLAITDVNCWNGLSSGNIIVENVIGGTGPYVYAIGQNGFNSIPSFNQLTSGSYQVYVQDANGCEGNEVGIVNLPDQFEVNLGDDYEINLGESIELEVLVNSNNALIEWNVDSCQNCPVLDLMPLNTTGYQVNVLDTITGCSDSDVVWVYVSKERKVFIPNAFSPDENGLNDYATIFADDASVRSIPSFRIFNRWGDLVFERENMIPNVETEGWDGYFNNKKMQNGVYIYIAEIEFIDGETEIFKGDITLME